MTVKVRLLFVDQGSYHSEDVELPEASLARHERLVDCLQEDPEVLRRVWVDVARLCAAWQVGDAPESPETEQD